MDGWMVGWMEGGREGGMDRYFIEIHCSSYRAELHILHSIIKIYINCNI